MVSTTLVLLLSTCGAFAYSVLTHEEIVDLVWADQLRPLLLQRFPSLTEDQLKEAHGYAYGGAVIQDLGYYPLGKAAEYSLTDETYAKLLSQLTQQKFALTSRGLRENILNFYGDLSLPLETKKDAVRWQIVVSSLNHDQLKLFTPAPILAARPAD